MSQSGNARPERRDADVVLVRNDSGADVGRFGILGIGGPIITPEDNLDEFKRMVAVSGVTPHCSGLGRARHRSTCWRTAAIVSDVRVYCCS